MGGKGSVEFLRMIGDRASFSGEICDDEHLNSTLDSIESHNSSVRKKEDVSGSISLESSPQASLSHVGGDLGLNSSVESIVESIDDNQNFRHRPVKIQEPTLSIDSQCSNVSYKEVSDQSNDSMSTLETPRAEAKICPRSKITPVKTDSSTDDVVAMEEEGSMWYLDVKSDEYTLGDIKDSKDTGIVWPSICVPRPLYDSLYNHQKSGVQWMASMHNNQIGGILGDDMGMGKTYQTLTFIGALMKAKTIKSALVVVPVTLLRTWEKEAERVIRRLCLPQVNINVVSSDIKKERRSRLLVEALSCSPQRPHLVITTYGLVGSSPLSFVPDGCAEWDYVILDEGHKIKNPSAKVTKSCHRICRSKNTRRLLLTGTPVQNNLKELWALFDFATSSRILRKLPYFTNRFAVPIEAGRNKNATEWTMRTADRASNELQVILKPHFLQRMKSSIFATSLPKKRELVVWTHLSNKQRQLYKDYVENGRHVASILTGETTSPLVAITWLKKLCGHPFLVQNESRDPVDIRNENAKLLVEDSAKLQVLVALTHRLQKAGHRFLIFSQSTRMLDIIQVALEHVQLARIDGKTKERDRQMIVDNFNEEDSLVEGLLLSTKAGGLGLTLTGASRAIIYDPSWNPAEDAQAVDRCYRIGQRKNVTIYRFISAGTVEEKMYEKQVHKDGIRRTVMTNGGNQTTRYFDKTELSKLFELAPLGQCSMLEKVKHQSSGNGVTGGSGKPSFLDSHPSVCGISSHDLVYQASVVNVDDPQQCDLQPDTPFAGTPFGGHQSERPDFALSTRKLDFGNVKSSDQFGLPKQQRASDSAIPLGRKTTLSREVARQYGGSSYDCGSPILQKEDLKLSQTKDLSVEDVDSLIRAGRPRACMELLLNLLDSGDLRGKEKLDVQTKIAALGSRLGWI
eukprot:scaffold60734_cov59-Attheya_sp.AAC.3